MKVLFGIFLFMGIIGASFKKSGFINDTVAEAQKLYKQQKYHQAIQKYVLLRDSLDVTEPELKLNLAHALFQNNDNRLSRKYYQELSKDANLNIQSVALTQLAILDFNKNNPEKALYHLRRAIIQNPENEEARFNYELIKKYVAQNPSGTPSNKNKKPKTKNNPKSDQTSPAKPSENGNEGTVTDKLNRGYNAANQKQDESGGNGGFSGEKPNQKKPTVGDEEKGDQGRNGNENLGLSKEENEENRKNKNKNKKLGKDAAEQNARQLQTLRARFLKTDLPPEKAMQLLEAMRNAELQYLQQLPRKSSRNNQDKNTPDY